MSTWTTFFSAMAAIGGFWGIWATKVREKSMRWKH